MFERQIEIPSAEEIRERTPLPAALAAIKAERDELVKDVIAGRSDKLLVIVGPCSAHESAPVLEYVRRLGRLNERVRDKLVLVPRIYTNKPRTRGVGYKGMFSQPDPNSKEDIARGIETIRRLHIDAMEISGLSAADEMLYPENHVYLDDLLTYVAVGARSSEDQQHRLVASGVDIPCGIKNPMNGSFPVTLNSIYAAQIANEFKYRTCQVRTEGNPYAHAILRGSVDVYGNNIPNYHYEDLMRFIDMYEKQGLKNPAVIVDTNHSNSGKNYIEQIRIVKEVVDNIRHNDRIRRYVRGFLIESYIEDGAQPVTGCEYGKSVTDPCLGWEKTERLLLDVADKL